MDQLKVNLVGICWKLNFGWIKHKATYCVATIPYPSRHHLCLFCTLLITDQSNSKKTDKRNLKMGMHSYIRLAIVDHQNGQSIAKEEKKTIIQALYNDKVANPKEMAQNAFDLNGDVIDSIPWDDVQENIQKFSENYPDYIFILRERSAEEEFQDEEPCFSSFYQGECVSLRSDLIDNAF